MTTDRETPSSWTPVPVRLATGAVLSSRAASALATPSARANLASMLRRAGAPSSEPAVLAVGVAQLLGGVAIGTGWAVRPASGALLAAALLNLGNAARLGGLPSPLPGGRALPGAGLSAFYAAAGLSLMLGGPGRWALSGRR